MRAKPHHIFLLALTLSLLSLALPAPGHAAKTRAVFRLCEVHAPWQIFPDEHLVHGISASVFTGAESTAARLLQQKAVRRETLPGAVHIELPPDLTLHTSPESPPQTRVPRSEQNLLIPALKHEQEALPQEAAAEEETEAAKEAASTPSLGEAIFGLRVRMLALRVEDNAAFILELAARRKDAAEPHRPALSARQQH